MPTLRGFVGIDANYDRLISTSDAPAQVRLTVVNAVTNTIDSVQQVTGNYAIPLMPGIYFVEVDQLPEGYAFTAPNAIEMAGLMQSDISPLLSKSSPGLKGKSYTFQVLLGDEETINCGLAHFSLPVVSGSVNDNDALIATPALSEYFIGYTGRDDISIGTGEARIFLFNSTENFDVVRGFKVETDKFDLSAIFANQLNYSGSDPLGDKKITVEYYPGFGAFVGVDFDAPNSGLLPTHLAFVIGVSEANPLTNANFIW